MKIHFKMIKPKLKELLKLIVKSFDCQNTYEIMEFHCVSYILKYKQNYIGNIFIYKILKI